MYKLLLKIEIFIIICCFLSDEYWDSFIAGNILLIIFLLIILLKDLYKFIKRYNENKKQDIYEKQSQFDTILKMCVQKGTLEDVEILEQMLKQNEINSGSKTERFELILTIYEIYNFRKNEQGINEYFENIKKISLCLDYNEFLKIAESRYNKKDFLAAIFVYSCILFYEKIKDVKNIPEIYYLRGKSYYEAENYLRASEDFKVAIEKAKEISTTLSYIEVEQYLQERIPKYFFNFVKTEQAQKKYNDAIEHYQEIPETSKFYQDAQQCIKECTKRIKDLNKQEKLQKEKQKAEGLYNEALRKFEDNDYLYAENLINEAIKIVNDKKYQDLLGQINKQKQQDMQKKQAEQARLNENMAEMMVKGKEFLNKGNLSKAVTEFSKAIAIKENAENLFLRGKAYLLQGYGTCQEAIEDFEKAIKFAPTNDEYHYYCGKAYHERYDYEKAIKCYSKAIKIKNDNWEYYCSCGNANYQAGNYADSVDDFYSAVHLNKNLVNDEDYKFDIKKAFEKILEITESNDKAYYLQALYLAEKDCYQDEALEAIEKAIKLNNKKEYEDLRIKITDILNENNNLEYDFADNYSKFDDLISKVTHLIQNKEYLQALNLVNDVLKSYPNMPEGIMMRALCNLNLKNYQETLEDTSYLIHVGFATRICFSVQGTTYKYMNNNESAIENYTKAIEIDLEDGNWYADIFYQRGQSYVYINDLKNALRDFTIALILNNEYIEDIKNTLLDLYDEDTTTEFIHTMSKITKACKDGEYSIEEFLPKILELNLEDINSQTDIQVTSKVRKIDL